MMGTRGDGMRVFLMVLLLCCLGFACAEEAIPTETPMMPMEESPETEMVAIPELPQMQLATDLSPGFKLNVYTGPCMCLMYVHAANRNARVSTNGDVYVFGETPGLHNGTDIMIAYQTDSGNWRVGYIGFKELIGKFPVLEFSNVPVTLQEPLVITDDPFTDGEPLGTIRGDITILATLDDWYYVDGILDGLDPVDRYASRMVRGFIKQSELHRLFEMP